MLLLPLPLLIAEFLIFYLVVKAWGFFNALGLYLLPCILGFFIVSMVGRMAVFTLQKTVMRGQLPASQILHSGAIFIAGLLLLVPTFFTRVVGFALLLPGSRHLAVWRFKLYLAQKISRGFAGFAQGSPFGFSGGSGGFRFYGFTQEGFGRSEDSSGGFSPAERDVSPKVLDVTPIEVSHEKKKEDDK